MTNQDRRRFLARATGSAFGLALSGHGIARGFDNAPAIITSDSLRPQLPQGIQFGDIGSHGVVVWARSDRTARMWLELSGDASFHQATRLPGAIAAQASDYTARMHVGSFPATGERQHVRVAFEDITTGTFSEWVPGHFSVPGKSKPKAIRFVWGGDVAGQGWGINPDIGGMRIFETMRQRQPDFFIHSGDTIYADAPMVELVTAEGGQPWRNLIADGVHKVAETLEEYRGRYRYNFRDDNVRRFATEVPQLWQWDDHEVVNNWSPGKDLSADDRYTVKDINVLIQRGRQAFLEYSPMRLAPAGGQTRIDRTISYGPLLDVFMVDMRHYRAANNYNLQPAQDAQTVLLGARQLTDLTNAIVQSKAVWKVIAADMPLALLIRDGQDSQGRDRWEAVANGDHGIPRGRELEYAQLLKAIKDVPNIIWVTADVHYAAAHYYDPQQAAFQDFSPFWEFVAGPLNAGSFGPVDLDNTFGPEAVFFRAPPTPNTSPMGGYQFFGEVNINPDTHVLTVDLRDTDGASVYTKQLQPAPA